MALDTISGLQQAVIDWPNVGLTTLQAQDVITIGEKRIYRELRVRQMEATTTIAITNGSAAVPSDYIESKNARLNSEPNQVLTRTTVEQLKTLSPYSSPSGSAKYFARDGSNFIFGGSPSGSLVLNYYAKPATVVGSTLTGITLAYPDLLLFAAMCEVEPYSGRDERTAIWEQKYQNVKSQVEKESRSEDTSGSTLEVIAN